MACSKAADEEQPNNKGLTSQDPNGNTPANNNHDNTTNTRPVKTLPNENPEICQTTQSPFPYTTTKKNMTNASVMTTTNGRMNHTPAMADVGFYVKTPPNENPEIHQTTHPSFPYTTTKKNMTNTSTTTTRPANGRTNHTPAMAGVWFYIRTQGYPKQPTPLPYASTQQRQPGPLSEHTGMTTREMDEMKTREAPAPHTCLSGCVVISRTRANHPLLNLKPM
ncbi:hypothetical protein BS47DRAFT_1360755 [Hydnum rufescens UP504]|uniref:Uncharacterized protein n=1 Tax=Hydnum rufescens UP504 TaxID=1448309 RepID=A0A9P6B166_9AGAM|nr:hypothetical protein BS47DRAFT_1360755 [Hydnum rufescens UP504]